MLKHLSKIIVCCLMLITAAPTFADNQGSYYIGLFGGGAITPDIDIGGLSIEFEPGLDLGGSVGYKYSPFRGEVEFTYMYTDIDQVRISGLGKTSMSGEVEVAAVMVNALFDFDNLDWFVVPYVGFGVGYAYLELELSDSTGSFTASEDHFAYQILAGINYNFSGNWAASLGYRYFRTDDINNTNESFENHLINIGFTYSF